MRCDARRSRFGPTGFVAGLHRFLPPFFCATSLGFLFFHLTCAHFLSQRPPLQNVDLITWVWLLFLWVKCRDFCDLNYYREIDEVWAPTFECSWSSSSPERPVLCHLWQRNLLTLPPNCRVKQSHGKRVGGWGKSEMVATDLQPHAGNAAWLHHLLSHTGLCNSLDMVHSATQPPYAGPLANWLAWSQEEEKYLTKSNSSGQGWRLCVSPWKETVAPMKMVQHTLTGSFISDFCEVDSVIYKSPLYKPSYRNEWGCWQKSP